MLRNREKKDFLRKTIEKHAIFLLICLLVAEDAFVVVVVISNQKQFTRLYIMSDLILFCVIYIAQKHSNVITSNDDSATFWF